MHRNIRILAVLLCLVLLTGALTGCGALPENTKIVLTTGLSDQQIFRINTAICTKSEALVYLANLKNKYEKAYGRELWDVRLASGSVESELKDSVLRELEQIKIMNLMADQYQVSLSKEDESRLKQAAGKYYKSLSGTETAALGVTQDSILQMYREYEIANRVYDSMIADVNPEISDDEARIITVKQIGLKTYTADESGKRTEMTEDQKKLIRRKADTAHSLAVSGTDFDSLISQYSDAAESEVSFGKGEKDSAYETAAFNLGKDEISDVIETADGYYILKCTSTFNKDQTDTNKKKILEKRKSDAFNEEYNAFAKSVTRELNEKVWDAITVQNDSQITTADFFADFDDAFGTS